ncbi:menaquinone biosynthetic enzyme MqnA/MqnD family protein [Engelhardtia mirabilis]|uniref:Chorismate dehydratase n=1 Tax=Engelhardtia mirabilis TaxID=2528011 RepID=A0A518BMV1_9BACT|nr:Chorismate dehydratase [Planctomycetes bacterium Pla133]
MDDDPEPRLRVGSVPYLVGRPLDAGLERVPGLVLRRAIPAELVADLRSGALDVALVSSIELFRRPGYRWIGGLGVLGDGPVSSVQLFLRRPPAELERVALDPASRTSAVLARIVLAQAHGVRPEFVEVEPGADPREATADAWLRIGDAALRERLSEPDLESLDPSLEWKRLTGLPFPFAAWIVRPGIDLAPWLAHFRASRDLGRREAGSFADRAAEGLGLSRDDCRHYLLEECRFDADDRMAQALVRFRDLAAAIGQCEPDLTPTAIA